MTTGANHLHTANEQYEARAKVINDVIWDWDLSTNKLWWNEGFKNIFGYNDAEQSIDSWISRIHPNDHERVTTTLEQVIANGEEKWSEEYRFLRADGTYAYVLDRGYTVVQNDKAVRMVGCMIDITEQKQLRAAKEKNRRMDALCNGCCWFRYLGLGCKIGCYQMG